MSGSGASRVRREARGPSTRAAADQHGFTYLGILFAVAFIGVGLAATGELWSMARRHADEQELLFIGHSFRHAIASYYRAGSARQYPRSLADLLEDNRTPRPTRHLRKIYADPITRSVDWHLVTLADGAIIGVASRSTAVPLKTANFSSEDRTFEDAECYCDWQFVFLPQLAPLERGDPGNDGLRGLDPGRR
jgi:type II secretory pathway pseudopilin PulG